MAPSRTSIIAATLLLASSTTHALPQQKIDASMPMLADVASTATWWTPSASASVWTPWSTASSPTSPVAAVTTSAPYSNPFTIYTTMTDSRGVITGMPAVVTSQPSLAPVATVCSGCASVLSAEASWSSMVASLYTTSTPLAATINATATSSSRSSSTGTAIATVTFAQHTNAASRGEVLSGGAVLAMIGAVAAII